MAELVCCSRCGNLILVKDDDKYQEPRCYQCSNNENNLKKVLDKDKGSDIIVDEI